MASATGRLWAGSYGLAALAAGVLVLAGCQSTGKPKTGQNNPNGDSPATVQDPPAKDPPVASSPQSIARGKTLFEQNCAICHGKEGQGGGPAAAAYSPSMTDLTNAEVQNKSGQALFSTITNGAAKGMPPFKNALSAEQRWDLVNFVHSLGKAQ